MINQIDNEDFFEQEFGNEDVLKNPLDNPLAKLDSFKGKKKDDSSKSEKESSSKGDSLNQLSLGEDITPIKFDNSLPKIYSTKKQKAGDGSSSPPANNKSQKKTQNKENTPTGVLTESNQSMNGKKQSDADMYANADEAFKRAKAEQNNEESYKEERENTLLEKDPSTEKTKKTAPKGEKAPINRELEELRNELNEKDEIVERFAIENDQLLKERNEIKALAEAYQEKVNALDKNLSQVLGKNTNLEEQINKLKKDLSQAQQRSTSAPEVSQERKETIDGYIHHCVEQYKTDLSLKLVEDLNKNILEQLAMEEGEVSEETKELMNLWIAAKPELTADIIPTEKIIQPFYDENLLKEEIEFQKQENYELKAKAEGYEQQIQHLQNQFQATDQTLKKYTEDSECQKQENHQLRTRAEEYEERIRQLENQLQTTDQTLKKYTEDFENQKHQLRTQTEEYIEQIRQLESQLQGQQSTTDETLKKYTEEFIKFEQDIENMREEIAEYKAVLNTRTEDLQKAERLIQGKDARIKELEGRVRSETAAKEDLGQQYEGIVQGMKDFEKTMMDLNTENERLSTEYQTMKDQLDAEIKKAKENQHTLSVEIKNNLLEKLAKLNCFSPGYEIQSAIDSGLKKTKSGRISSEELISLMDSELFIMIEKIYGKFNSELEEERYFFSKVFQNNFVIDSKKERNIILWLKLLSKYKEN